MEQFEIKRMKKRKFLTEVNSSYLFILKVILRQIINQRKNRRYWHFNIHHTYSTRRDAFLPWIMYTGLKLKMIEK